MSFVSPFAASTSKPGHGNITLAILPPDQPVLRTLAYQYPLKLVAPDPLPPPGQTDNAPRLVHTVFLLTYGGGLVAGDSIDLAVTLHGNARLILLTQGSTKIFKTPSRDLVTRQSMTVHLDHDAALVYLPDPVQPFAQTSFSQAQRYMLHKEQGNLCVCDWVTSGRSARGENWDMYEYTSRNEVWSVDELGTKRLLLRDNLVLNELGQTEMRLASRMDGYSVFGTLILRGSLFHSLSSFFLHEFDALPRIGGRDWGEGGAPELTAREQWRLERQQREKVDGLVWSAARVRGFVLVKFASRGGEGSRKWLRDMLTEEGSVSDRFGERSILCLK